MSRAKRIFIVVAYDIENDRNRAKVAKLLEKCGSRINYSVFECMLTETQYNNLQKQIQNKINPKTDTVAYYRICVDCYTKIVYQPQHRPAPRIVQIV